jgi:uncharacterized protein YhbP (UPF0306 family)
MAIEQSKRRVSRARLETAARELLDASTLCAISTVGPRGSAYVNTAYFAWSRELDVIWLSEPNARHSRNIEARRTAAIAVYDSSQSWGAPDRGIQLFGSARRLAGQEAAGAAAVYAARFPDYRPEAFAAYRLYSFRPRRVKLFDERELGPGRFLFAGVDRGRLSWEGTQIYRAGP